MLLLGKKKLSFFLQITPTKNRLALILIPNLKFEEKNAHWSRVLIGNLHETPDKHSPIPKSQSISPSSISGFQLNGDISGVKVIKWLHPENFAMEDISSPGRFPYEAAKPFKKKSTSEWLENLFQFFLDFLKFLILCIPIMAKYLKEIFSSSEPKKIAGQLALVTGGGNGLGKAIAIRLAKEGCNVAVVDVDLQAAERVAGDIKCFGIKSKAYKVDVSNFNEVKALGHDIEEDLGAVDILVNNAGIMPVISLMEGSSADIEKILSVNLTSHFWTVRVFLESMIRRRKGHIVAVSSLSGLDAAGRAIAYSASKFGVRGFMEALREEIRLNGNSGEIFTTTVYPYFISTRRDLMEKMQKTSLFQRFPPLIPDDAADILVDAMLDNEISITIPRHWPISRVIFKCLPSRIQDLVREVLVKEYIPRIQL